MRDDELQLGARDKVVQKMTREGAVEENISKNSERRVSARASDADFSHLHEEEARAAVGQSEKSRVGVQQKRYYKGKSDEPVLERDRETLEADGPETDLEKEGRSRFKSIDSADDSTDLNNEVSTKVSDGPDRRDGKALKERSRRAQNVRTERSDYGGPGQNNSGSDNGSDSRAASGDSGSSSSGSSTDQSHQRKKRQTQKAQSEQQESSKLSFEDDTSSKGTNLGGRFSSVTGKAAQTGKNVVDDSMQAGNDDENDVSRDVVHKSEIVAANVAGAAKNQLSGRTKSTSSRMASIGQEAEAKASKLQFEAEAETTKASLKASSKASAAEAAKTSAKKEAQRHARNKKYASVFRSKNATTVAAGGTAKTAEGTVTIADRIKNTATAVVKKNKGVIAVGLVVVLMFVALLGGIGTMGSIISGTGTTVMQSTYLASDDEIYAAEDAYAAMETALQRQIDNIESTYPGYDEYNYQVDEISHNPYYLTSYLTVLYGNYKAADVQAELERLFREQYHLSVEGSTQTITETRTVRVGESLGSVVTSGYCNCVICCGRWAGGATASGAMPQANHTIAVDASNPIVPMGTKVVMNGVEYTVEDTGNFAQYGVAFDVYYDSHSAASAHGHQTWEAYIADDNGSQTVEVTETRTVKVLNVTLENSGFDTVARSRLGSDEAINWYSILNAAFGNRDYLWDTTAYSGYTPGGMSYDIPPEALTDARFRNMITEAEKYLGYPYVWGGSSPSTSFDCSGFVSWVINNCGNGWNYGRLTAEGLRGVCTYVSPDQAKPGDLIFFQGTYDTAGASHVGIYVGNGMMIHCGNPIQYTSIETNYWQQHFYCFGRLP